MEHEFLNYGGMEREETDYRFINIKEDVLEGRLLKPREAAAYLGSSVSALSQYRALEIGPEYFKVGKMVRYRRSDIDKWLEQKKSSKK